MFKFLLPFLTFSTVDTGGAGGGGGETAPAPADAPAPASLPDPGAAPAPAAAPPTTVDIFDTSTDDLLGDDATYRDVKPVREGVTRARQEYGQIAEALDGLPADQREVVRLRFLEGWAFKEIAAHLERSEDSVAGLLKRGLRNLRKNFDATDQ